MGLCEEEQRQRRRVWSINAALVEVQTQESLAQASDDATEPRHLPTIELRPRAAVDLHQLPLLPTLRHHCGYTTCEVEAEKAQSFLTRASLESTVETSSSTLIEANFNTG